MSGMNETYLATFARPNGRIFHGVGQMEVELYEGAPIDQLNWYGEVWTRVSDVRDGIAHYVPYGALAP